MAKFGGLDGTSTANLDLYESAKTQEGWTGYVPFRKVAFIPTADCTIKVNNGSVITVPANIGWSEDNAQINSFIVIDANIVYKFSYRW